MFSDIRQRLRALLRRKRVEAELDEELRFHIERQTEKYVQSGLTIEEARRRARIDVGGMEKTKEECRDARGVSFIETTIRDVRYGLRQLRRSPGFTVVAILTLALGIGANTAIFSVVEAVMLRPLPYPHAERIVHLSWKSPKSTSFNLTIPMFEFWRDHSSAFKSLTGLRSTPEMELQVGATREWVNGMAVTDGFLETLGISPALGHGITRASTQPGAARIAILTDHLWRTSFQSSKSAIGRQIVLNGRDYMVAGVLPPRFTLVRPADVLVSLQTGNSLTDRGFNTDVIGRLRSGISLGQANAEMPVLANQFRAQSPPLQRMMEGTVQLEPYQTYLSSSHRTILLLLLGVVSLLLLIACANVASLLLARATARQCEISVRLALGAGRRRLLRQFLTESLFLGLAGAAAGLAMALGVLRAAVSAIPWQLPATTQIRLDRSVFLFTLLMGIATSIAFGLAGYFQSRGIDWSRTLKEGRAIAGLGRRSGGVLKLFIVGEVAISLVLALGAGLFLVSLYRLYQQKLGFDPAGVVTVETAPVPGRPPSATVTREFERQMLARLQAIPGVTSAALVSVAPLSGKGNIPVQREGHPEDSIGATEYRAISPGYFSTMKIPLLRGRQFLVTDSFAASPVAIINQTLARAWWPGKNPLGDRVVVGQFHGHNIFNHALSPREIVGVVGDTKLAIDRPAPPMIYVPSAQDDLTMNGGGTAWVLRTGAVDGLRGAVGDALSQSGSGERIIAMRSESQLVGTAVSQPRFNALLLGGFGALALVLTLVGAYGVLSFELSQRVHEIGVRVALGAQRGDLLRLIVGQAMKLAAIGVVLGLAAAAATAHLAESLLFDVNPVNPTIYAAATILLLIVAFIAAYIPARRAMQVDPAVALRHE